MMEIYLLSVHGGVHFAFYFLGTCLPVAGFVIGVISHLDDKAAPRRLVAGLFMTGAFFLMATVLMPSKHGVREAIKFRDEMRQLDATPCDCPTTPSEADQ